MLLFSIILAVITVLILAVITVQLGLKKFNSGIEQRENMHTVHSITYFTVHITGLEGLAGWKPS